MRKLASLISLCAVVLLGWYSLLAGVSFALPAGSPLLVFAPGRAMDIAVHDGTFEGGNRHFAYTRAAHEGYLTELYAKGAWLVIDGRAVQSCRTILAQAFKSGA